MYEVCIFPSDSVIDTVYVPRSNSPVGVKVKVSTVSKVIKLFGITFVIVVVWPSASVILGN